MLQWIYVDENKTSLGDGQQIVMLFYGLGLSENEHHLHGLEQNQGVLVVEYSCNKHIYK